MLRSERPTIETRIPTMSEMLDAYLREHGSLPALPSELEQGRQRYTMRDYRAGLRDTRTDLRAL